jgi:hypothetical protein
MIILKESVYNDPLEGLNKTINSYLHEEVDKHIQEIICNRLKMAGYPLDKAMADANYLRRMKTCVTYTLRAFPDHMKDFIDNWVNTWNDG